ncbi:MAG TPA: GMP synthase (glutamine-hydrolyzing), partial [Armatimonadetes bacterium]|nr:GMP synthase (glutamine-hydrolyzing) [Armatimonadota bacterium]
LDNRIFDLGIPIFGICYGMQLMAQALQGVVHPGNKREYGKTDIQVLNTSDLFAGLDDRMVAWMSHGDTVSQVPDGFKILAKTANTPVAAMSCPEKGFYAVQFHPEVVHTPKGKEVIRNFLFGVCKCKGLWTMKSFIDEAVEGIKKQVGDGRVVCGLSGGVDSSAVAALIHRAVGSQLTCIFVNNGLLRKGEAEVVQKTFGDNFHMKLVYVNAEERFLTRLSGVIEPEKKRKIIGEEFVRI